MHLSTLYAKLLREGRRDGRPGGLHLALRQATRWRLLAVNPASDLELPTVPKSEMVTLTREQAGVLLAAAEPRPLMRSLVLLGVATGARLGELLASPGPTSTWRQAPCGSAGRGGSSTGGCR